MGITELETERLPARPLQDGISYLDTDWPVYQSESDVSDSGSQHSQFLY